MDITKEMMAVIGLGLTVFRLVYTMKKDSSDQIVAISTANATFREEIRADVAVLKERTKDM